MWCNDWCKGNAPEVQSHTQDGHWPGDIELRCDAIQSSSVGCDAKRAMFVRQGVLNEVERCLHREAIEVRTRRGVHFSVERPVHRILQVIRRHAV